MPRRAARGPGDETQARGRQGTSCPHWGDRSRGVRRVLAAAAHRAVHLRRRRQPDMAGSARPRFKREDGWFRLLGLVRLRPLYRCRRGGSAHRSRTRFRLTRAGGRRRCSCRRLTARVGCCARVVLSGSDTTTRPRCFARHRDRRVVLLCALSSCWRTPTTLFGTEPHVFRWAWPVAFMVLAIAVAVVRRFARLSVRDHSACWLRHPGS